MTAAKTGIDQPSIHLAAEWIAKAENPAIFAQRGAGGPDGFSALAKMAETWGIPVCQYWAVRLALALDHPMATSSDPAPLLAEADVILVIDSLAPWAPDSHRPKPGCKVIHLGQDPLFSRFPVRNFRCDLAIASDVEPGLLALKQELDAQKPHEQRDNRRNRLAERNADTRG